MTANKFNSLYKEGDVIMFRQWATILYKLEDPNEFFPTKHAIVYYATAHIGSVTCAVPSEPSPGIGWLENYTDDNIRLATNKEKEILFNWLNEKGVKWDEENKRIINISNE